MKYRHLLILATCAAGLALCPALRAQDASPAPSTSGTEGHFGGHHGGGGGGPGGGANLLQRLTDELALTEDQQAKIKPILETTGTTMRAIRQDTTLSPQDRMAKMKAAREDMTTQIKAILTPEQQTKYAAFQQQMHNRRRGGGGAGGGVSGGSSPADSSPAASPAPASTP